LGPLLGTVNRKEEARANYQRTLTLAQTIYPDFQDRMIEEVKENLR
jgi:hypothetical protein